MNPMTAPQSLQSLTHSTFRKREDIYPSFTLMSHSTTPISFIQVHFSLSSPGPSQQLIFKPPISHRHQTNLNFPLRSSPHGLNLSNRHIHRRIPTQVHNLHLLRTSKRQIPIRRPIFQILLGFDIPTWHQTSRCYDKYIEVFRVEKCEMLHQNIADLLREETISRGGMHAYSEGCFARGNEVREPGCCRGRLLMG